MKPTFPATSQSLPAGRPPAAAPVPDLAPAIPPQTTLIHGVREPVVPVLRARRPVPGYEGRYEVTRTGLVYSHKKKDFLKDAFEVLLHDAQGGAAMVRTSRLVALAWLSPEQRAEVRAEHARVTDRQDWKSHAERLALRYAVSHYAVRAAPYLRD